MPTLLRSLALLCASLAAGCASVANTQFHGAAIPATTAPDFTLVDDHGAPWTLSSHRGATIALFFGYTHCTDTCPTTLAKLATAFGEADPTHRAVIAFVTVDPQRDTPPVLARYLAHFSGARIVGLTGAPAHITDVEHAYHIWAQKTPGRRGKDDYDDAHSSVVYLIDRDGNERVMHDADDSVESFAADMRILAS